MKQSHLTTVLLSFSLLVSGCLTAMTPLEFSKKFPESTTSRFYDRADANEAITKGGCKLLVKGRKYTAPIGFTTYGDVDNAAAGVDEWVQVDGGNAYALNNFEWISVGDQGTTQLIVYFDSMLCE